MEILEANHLIIGSESIKEKKLRKDQNQPIVVSATMLRLNIASKNLRNFLGQDGHGLICISNKLFMFQC